MPKAQEVPDKCLVAQLNLASLSCDQAMRKLSSLYTEVDDNIRRTLKSVVDIQLSEVFRITDFWSMELTKEEQP